jgi:sec-independent protein translocase protein TatB
MNLFSNVGITELIVILLLALLVVGPERLPELGQKLGKALRDVRAMYDNLTKDLGPELASFQDTTRELRESVESVRSIPQDMVKQVTKAAELDDAIGDLKHVAEEMGQVSAAISNAGAIVKDPIQAAASTAKDTLLSPLDQEEEPEHMVAEVASEGLLASSDLGTGQVEGNQPGVERNDDGPADPSEAPAGSKQRAVDLGEEEGAGIGLTENEADIPKDSIQAASERDTDE